MNHAIRLAAGNAASRDLEAWPQLVPQTLVERIAEALIAQAARGVILPGDRIVESDLGRRLGVSRVPVREALRMLESQGIVINEPYKGIRLREVTNQRVRDLIEARTALETIAAHRAVDAGRHLPPWCSPVEAATQEMAEMASRGDAYGLAAADTAFHRALCMLGGNSVIVDLWETLAQQLTIIFGLATTGKTMPSVVSEHRELLGALRTGDKRRIAKVLHTHITLMNVSVDYEAIIDARRAARASRCADVA
jgi:DNA-binding GntR family transcriptional regulator